MAHCHTPLFENLKPICSHLGALSLVGVDFHLFEQTCVALLDALGQNLSKVVLEVRFVASHHIVIHAPVVAALILSCDPDEQSKLIEVVLLDHFAAQVLVFHLVQLWARHSHDGIATGLSKAA